MRCVTPTLASRSERCHAELCALRLPAWAAEHISGLVYIRRLGPCIARQSTRLYSSLTTIFDARSLQRAGQSQSCQAATRTSPGDHHSTRRSSPVVLIPKGLTLRTSGAASRPDRRSLDSPCPASCTSESALLLVIPGTPCVTSVLYSKRSVSRPSEPFLKLPPLESSFFSFRLGSNPAPGPCYKPRSLPEQNELSASLSELTSISTARSSDQEVTHRAILSASQP